MAQNRAGRVHRLAQFQSRIRLRDGMDQSIERRAAPA